VRLAQRADRVVPPLVDGDVEMALGLGQSGARLRADRTPAGVDEVGGSRDRGARGQHGLVQRRGRPADLRLGVPGHRQRLLERDVGLLQLPQCGQRIGRGPVGRPHRRVGGRQRGLRPRDLRTEPAAVAARDQRAGLREVLLRLGPHGGHPAARRLEVGGQAADRVQQRGRLRHGVLRRADVADGVPGPARTQGVERLVHLLLGCGQARRGLGDIVPDGGQRRLGEAAAEVSQAALLLRDALP
jgi:hypothetical protein